MARPSAWPAGSAPRSVRPTASSWCRVRTKCQSLSARLRDRRVPLHLLRLLPGSVPGRGDHVNGTTSGLQSRGIRLRSRTADSADAPGVRMWDTDDPRANGSSISSISTCSGFAIGSLSGVSQHDVLSFGAVRDDGRSSSVLSGARVRGAIMVVFLFVVMLLNLGHRTSPTCAISVVVGGAGRTGAAGQLRRSPVPSSPVACAGEPTQWWLPSRVPVLRLSARLRDLAFCCSWRSSAPSCTKRRI